jgi:hypothetical protein
LKKKKKGKNNPTTVLTVSNGSPPKTSKALFEPVNFSVFI